MEVSYRAFRCISRRVFTFSNNISVVHLSLGIEASILDSIDVQELESLLKLNIQKGKAFSTLGQGKDGFKAFQSALDVSSYICTLLRIYSE